MTTTTAATTSCTSSAASIAKQIKTLLKPSTFAHDERADAARSDELRRLFASLIIGTDYLYYAQDDDKSNNSLMTTSTSPALRKWQSFLNQSHAHFVKQLCQRIHRKTAIRTMWSVLLASTPRKSHGDDIISIINTDLLLQFLQAVIQSMTMNLDRGMQTMLQGAFLHVYKDVQYYSF
jgi:hypothetical protein